MKNQQLKFLRDVTKFLETQQELPLFIKDIQQVKDITAKINTLNVEYYKFFLYFFATTDGIAQARNEYIKNNNYLQLVRYIKYFIKQTNQIPTVLERNRSLLQTNKNQIKSMDVYHTIMKEELKKQKENMQQKLAQKKQELDKSSKDQKTYIISTSHSADRPYKD